MNQRYSRQSFLGPDSAIVLTHATVGVIGLCGGGSHVCQQLAHVGIGRFVIADFDHVDDTNLNRMVGSCPADAETAKAKTEVIRDMICRINPAADVVCVDGRWQEHGMEFRDCSVIIGCVDSFSARDELERFCRRFLIPYIDVGMDVHMTCGGYSISGQVILSVPGGPCLWCLGLLTQERLAEEQRTYGAAGGRPQVIWPNGVLASVAVGHAISLLLPWNHSLPMAPMIEFDGNRHTLREGTRLAALKTMPCQHFPESGGVGDPFYAAPAGSIQMVGHSSRGGLSRLVKRLYGKWKSRKKYPSFGDMPTILVSFFGLAGFTVSGFYGFVLSKSVPLFVEIGNKIPLSDWGWKGGTVAAILIALAYVTWVFGSIAWRCNSILRDRLFK